MVSIYTEQRFNDIKQNPLGPVNPQYIEISFGNECNFKCGYCHPKHSSAYYKEIKDFFIMGRDYGLANRTNLEALSKINDFDWLKERFNAR